MQPLSRKQGYNRRMLKVISGTKPADTPKQRVRDRIKAMAKPAEMIQCPRCGCREVIETKTGVLLKDGKPSGGTKSLICASCYRHGERIVLV